MSCVLSSLVLVVIPKQNTPNHILIFQPRVGKVCGVISRILQIPLVTSWRSVSPRCSRYVTTHSYFCCWQRLKSSHAAEEVPNSNVKKIFCSSLHDIILLIPDLLMMSWLSIYPHYTILVSQVGMRYHTIHPTWRKKKGKVGVMFGMSHLFYTKSLSTLHPVVDLIIWNSLGDESRWFLISHLMLYTLTNSKQ